MSVLPQMLVRTQSQCRFFPTLIETRNQAPVVQRADNATIRWINLRPLDSKNGFPNHPLDIVIYPVAAGRLIALSSYCRPTGARDRFGSVHRCKFCVETILFCNS